LSNAIHVALLSLRQLDKAFHCRPICVEQLETLDSSIRSSLGAKDAAHPVRDPLRLVKVSAILDYRSRISRCRGNLDQTPVLVQ
jgi:hypothetical protein